MHFSTPLIPGTLIKRYKRFMADVQLADGSIVTAHCPNSGSMATCAEPGCPVLISEATNPDRKLKYTWEMICMNGTWVGVNTSNPNAAVAQWIAEHKIPELDGYTSLKREVKYGIGGRSRIDILLQDPSRPDCYVEIKNATMRVDDYAAFPDAETTRGQKHLLELQHVVEQGMRGVIFFFVGRSDVQHFRPADEIDPVYGKLLRSAMHAGVDALAYRVHFTPTEITIQQRIDITL